MSGNSDNYVYENSMMSQVDEEPYKFKEYFYVQDQQGSNYSSGQITFDLAGFSNSNKYTSLAEAVLTLPVVVVLSQDNAAGMSTGAVKNDLAIAFKSGFWNLISSFSVDYDGQSVVQLSQNINAYCCYKANTTWSNDDVDTMGATLGFRPDTANSWTYNNAADSSRGNGISNNFYNDSAYATMSANYNGNATHGNNSLYLRQMSTCVNPAITTGQNVAAIRGETQFKNELKSYTKANAVASTAAYQVWYTTCVIRLKDLSSFFENFVPTKSAYARLTLNLNVGSLAMSVSTTTAWMNNSNNSFTNCCPVMLSAVGQGSNFTAGTTQAVLGVYVGQVSSSVGTINQGTLGVPAHPLPSCRITAPLITMNPQYELKYAQSNLSKTILYEDIYSTTLTNIASNNTFNYLVTNGIKGALKVVIIPLISASINGRNTGSATASATFSPLLSPFSTEPATASPLSITQFQVQFGGQNILSPFISYSYEEFLQQVNTNGLNGGQSTGLTSGLIDENSWSNCYRYYVCDLSRGDDDSSVNKSIVVSGFNNTLLSADYLIYVVYRKRAVINCQTGKLLSLS